MKRFDVPIQHNGRMILPAELRRALGVGKGDRVTFSVSEDRIELTTAQRSRERARQRFQKLFGQKQGHTDAFLTERQAEAIEDENSSEAEVEGATGTKGAS